MEGQLAIGQKFPSETNWKVSISFQKTQHGNFRKLTGNFQETSKQISNVGNFLESADSNSTKLKLFNPSRGKKSIKIDRYWEGEMIYS